MITLCNVGRAVILPSIVENAHRLSVRPVRLGMLKKSNAASKTALLKSVATEKPFVTGTVLFAA